MVPLEVFVEVETLEHSAIDRDHGAALYRIHLVDASGSGMTLCVRTADLRLTVPPHLLARADGTMA
jgi:hypothetical protein